MVAWLLRISVCGLRALWRKRRELWVLERMVLGICSRRSPFRLTIIQWTGMLRASSAGFASRPWR